jgi:hypothetical protein
MLQNGLYYSVRWIGSTMILTFKIALRMTVQSFGFVLVFIVLFTLLLISSVPANLWFFGLKDGHPKANQAESEFTRAYKQKFHERADHAVQRIDEMKGVSPAFKTSLKDLVRPDAAIGLGVARIRSFAIGNPQESNMPEPYPIIDRLSPIYHYKTITNDKGLRKVTVKKTHSIKHDEDDQKVTVVPFTLPAHREIERVVTATGTIQLFHHLRKEPWKKVQTKRKTFSHWIKIGKERKECVVTIEETIEERRQFTRVNDTILPWVKKQDGKLDSILHELGMKSEKDIKLVYAIANAEQGGVGNPIVTRVYDWLWPIPGYTFISSHYGPRWGEFHHGIDIPAPTGAPIIASKDGIIAYSGPAPGYGQAIYINHGKGVQTRYGHMSRLLVRTGDKVKAGEHIALNGNEGRSTGSHLHYEIRIGVSMNNPFSKTVPSVNPINLFPSIFSHEGGKE